MKAVLSGILLYLAFSKLSLWFLSFPALYMLARNRNLGFWLICGGVFFFLSLLWIRIAMIKYGEVEPVIAYLLIVLLVSVLVVYQFLLTFLIWKKLKFHLILLPFVWTLVEIMRSNFPYGGFPWLIMGEMTFYIPFFREYLSVGGVFLGSLILWILTLIPLIIRDVKSLAVALALLASPIPLIFRGGEERNETVEGIKIAIVQPNISEDVKLDTERFYESLPVYWRLLREASRAKPDVVFLPESAFPFPASELYEEGKELLRFSKEFFIVTGMIDLRFAGDIEPYNSVFVIKDGEVKDFYDKVRLLPFGEYVPFPFQFTKEIFGSIAGIDYRRGDGPRCVKAGKLSLATPICFEVSCFSYVKRFSECADIIAVVTNDGWFEDSDGTYQHLRHARIRALENRKFVLWINNTGPSAIISPSGEIIESIPYGRVGLIIYKFQSGGGGS